MAIRRGTRALQQLIAAVALFCSIVLGQLTTPISTTPPPHSPVDVKHQDPRPKVLPPHRSPSFFQPGNLHLVFFTKAGKLKVFTSRGDLLYQCNCRNETIAVGFLHFGACPHGTFRLGRTVYINKPAFGKWFTPLYDLTPDGPMHRYHRVGIGLHAGGSRLANPFVAYQQLLRTHGCLRIANHDQRVIVLLIHHSRALGRISYITVK